MTQSISDVLYFPERGQGDGFDLEALLEEVGEMMSDNISPSASTVEPIVRCLLSKFCAVQKLLTRFKIN